MHTAIEPRKNIEFAPKVEQSMLALYILTMAELLKKTETVN